MRSLLAVAAVLSVSAVAPSAADLGAALSARHQAVLAENESNGPSRFGRDTAQFAEASLPSAGGHDTAL